MRNGGWILMSISFLNPYFLLLLLPAAAFFWWATVKTKYRENKKLVLFLRCIMILLLIFALASPQLVQRFDGQSIVFLADISQSVDFGEDYVGWINESLKFKGKNDQSAVVAFSLETQMLKPFSSNNPIDLNLSTNRAFTNIEGALKLAQGILPTDTSNRIVLLSDGFENIGDSLSYARILRANGIPVDVYPLSLNILEEVSINQIILPSNTYAGQRISVEVEIESTVNTQGTLSLFWNERVIFNGLVNINAGLQKLVFPVEIAGSGFQRVRASIEPVSDTIIQNNSSQGLTLVESAPKVLVVEGTKDIGTPLYEVFKSNGVDVDLISVRSFPKNLESLIEYKSIFFVDVPAYFLTDSQLSNIKSFVEIVGGGFVTIGGKNSYGMGFYQDTPLEEILPITMEVEDDETLPAMDMVLVIDRSGSMHGEKLNMAKNAGIAALDLLDEKDRLGLITFDDSLYVDFALTSVTEKNRLERIIQNITLGGGTSIYPALEKAVSLFSDNGQNKHIILLSDGVEGPQNYDSLLKKMTDSSITLTAIALGDDADIKLMEYLAVNGGGRFYDVRNVSDLPGVFARETLLSAGNYIIEEDFTPTLGSAAYNPFKQGVPLLKGYIGSTLKPQAEGILFTHREHPLYARMQYGLGRTVAFTSDSYGMWTRNLMASSDFPGLWLDTLNWVSGLNNYGDLAIDVKLKDSGAVISAIVGNHLEEQEVIEVSVINEKGEAQNVQLRAVSGRTYEGVIPVLDQGVYFVNALRKQGEQITALNINGFSVPYSKEFSISNLSSTSNVMEEIVAQTGGRVLRRPYEVFNADYDPVNRSTNMTWLLLLLTLVLWPVDIAVRRFKPVLKPPKFPKLSTEPKASVESHTSVQSKRTEDPKSSTGLKIPTDSSTSGSKAPENLRGPSDSKSNTVENENPFNQLLKAKKGKKST